MLEYLLKLAQFAERAPIAIDYFYMPPHPQLVPDVALKKAYQTTGMWLSIVGLNNLSSRVLTDIRIKLNTCPQFRPVVEGSTASVEARCSYAVEESELSIVRLDPGECLYLHVFLSTKECEVYIEPQVILKDRLLSRGMRMIGYFKRRPRQAFLEAAAYMLMFCAVCAALYIAYIVTPLNPRIAAVREATASWSGCVPTAYPQSEVNESLLARHKFGDRLLFQMNKVVERKDLLAKQLVVICEDR